MKMLQSQILFILLSFLYLSPSFVLSPPPHAFLPSLSTYTHHNEQEMGEEERNIDERRGRLSQIQDGGKVLPSRGFYFFNSLYEDGREEVAVLRRDYYLPRPPPRPRPRNVKEERIVEKMVLLITTPLPPPLPPPPLPPPPPPPASYKSSFCSSLTCLWFTSWQFITLLTVLLTWILTLTSVLYLATTSWGQNILQSFTSFTHKEVKDQDNKVLAKGIGYFDGSPGMRRFVLIEDDDDDDVVDGDDSSIESEVGKIWKPPRKGKYFLQEPKNDYVLEFGTYRLNEDLAIDVEDDNVEYVLEGAAYILQSERITQQEEDKIRDIKELYGLIKQEGKIEEIEGLYGIIKQVREREEEEVRERETRNHEITLSVNDLEFDKEGHEIRDKRVMYTEERGGVRGKTRVGGSVKGERMRSKSTLHPPRAASFPMDNYCPVHLLPRKLSLIIEEEMH